MRDVVRVLEYLEKNLDLQHVEKAKKKTKDVISYQSNGCSLIVRVPNALEDFKQVPIQETHKTRELMLLNELVPCCEGTRIKDDKIYCIRANYGVGTLASLFETKTKFIDYNAMPWCEHLKDKAEVKRVIASGMPDIMGGFGKRIIETYEYYAEMLEKYPVVKEGIKLYHPDLQGPLDTAHLIYGTELYLDMYDDPEFVHELLSVVTDTYIGYMKKVKQYINDTEDGFCFHWNTLFPGEIVIRNDTAVNISVDMYNEFVRPYDERIIAEFFGASIHYCGQRISWLHDMLSKTKGLLGINFGRVPNYEYKEDFLKEVMHTTSEKQIGIISYCVDQEDLIELASKDYLRGISYITNASGIEEANELMKSLNI